MPVYHFVNLVGWQSVSRVCSDGDKIFCDSLTMQLAALLFAGHRPQRVSGVRFLSDLGPGKKIFLVRGEGNENQFTLPNYSDEDITVGQDLKDFVVRNGATYVILGISSPKQNILAKLLEAQCGASTNYICIGAALYHPAELSPLDSLGLNFLGFLMKAPKRTIIKMKLTCLEVTKLLLSREMRREFITFCNAAWAQKQ